MACKRYREKDLAAYRVKSNTAQRLRRAAESPEQRRIYYLRKNHGSHAPAHKLQQLELQQGLCAICEQKLSGWGEQDHNHATMKLRGVLCVRCNCALHYVEDTNWKTEAEKYLRKWDS